MIFEDTQTQRVYELLGNEIEWSSDGGFTCASWIDIEKTCTEPDKHHACCNFSTRVIQLRFATIEEAFKAGYARLVSEQRQGI